MTIKQGGVALVLLMLLGLPLLIAHAINESYRRQDARDDELEAKYECARADTCSGDFTGDGVSDRVMVVNGSSKPILTVVSNGREILRLPYDHTDGTLRTHTAVISNGHPSRLLIYDGVCYPTPLRTAFGWNGEAMVEMPPSDSEKEIINAMAAHDDTGGWPERAFRGLFIKASLAGYYLILAITLSVIVYRRYFRTRTPHAQKVSL